MDAPNPPIHGQSQSPLFSLPPEIRLHIFSFALTKSLDPAHPYSPDTYYFRPGYTAPRPIHTALLHTCKRVYAEARHFPFVNADLTFFLCSRARAPGFIPLPQLREFLARKKTKHGPLETSHIQIFAQLYVLEQNSDFQEVLDVAHLDPKRVTLTIRHSDFWFWEDWQKLHMDGEWVNRVRFPNSVVEFAIEMETIDKRAEEVKYLASEAVDKWFFTRKDGRILRAEKSDTSTSTWTGSSVLDDKRWIRDEARPGELDYHVVTNRWKLVPADGVEALGLDLSTPRPSLDIRGGVGQEPPSLYRRNSISVREMQRANVTKETPVDEVLQALNPARLNGRRLVRKATKLSPSRIQDILEVTLSEVDRPDSTGATIVNDWATESGFAWTREIVEADFVLSYSVTRLMFDPHCLLFLCILSYLSSEDIWSSLALEKPVGTIFNVIYGPHGNRGATFFRRVVDYLTQLHDDEEDPSSKSHYESGTVLLHLAEAILSTLLQVQEATFKAEFKQLTETLWTCFFLDADIHHLQSPVTRLARETLLKAQDIFHTGDGISVGAQRVLGAPKKANNSQPKIPVDPPGQLSQHGIRHDNDHASISDINILPTLSEIWYSRRNDFLPTKDALYSQDRHHESAVRCLLDTHFRFLREDTSGVLRDFVRGILENWEALVYGTRWQDKRRILRSHVPTPVRIYYGARIQKAKSDCIKGMGIDVEFDQVPRARNMSVWKRKQHWRNTRGLNEGGALLALIDAEVKDDITVIFFQVSKRNIDPVTDENDKNIVLDLVSSSKRALISLRLTNPPSGGDLDGIIHLADNQFSSSARSLILVEFPALLFNAFEGILRRLQALYKNPQKVPLTDWIVPQDTYPPGYKTTYGYKAFPVFPPAYLQNVTLDLSSIAKNEAGGNAAPITFSIEQNFNILCDELSKKTTLDMGQARAMISAFQNSLALIQGPPGTGKSYLGIQIAKCILANQDQLQLEPILCVCYTNHALDQFLQGLYDSGISRIVRIGSRSASPLLESLSLENYKKLERIPRISGHGRLISEQKRRLGELACKIGDICQRLQSGTNGLVMPFLKDRLPMQEVQIAEEVMVGDLEPLTTWARGSAPGDLSGNEEERTIEQLLSVNKWTLTNEERKRLLEYWHESAIEGLCFQLRDLMQLHASKKKMFTSLFNAADAQVFDQVDVVGITTTGLANNADLLRSLRADVLICEEAAEVLESHILTAFLPSVQHAILIGGHLQLRPKISTRRLSAEYDLDGPKYNLDESLFERLANFRPPNCAIQTEEGDHTADTIRFPVAQLDQQRRMHPSIASLVRGTLYPDLCDHPDTHLYNEISGFKRGLFWLDHRNTEDPDDPEDPMQSKTNTWEVEMVVSVVKHLCKQEHYKPGEIAVLTPYIGQLRLLVAQMDGIIDLVIAEQDLVDINEPGAQEDANDSKHNRRTVEKGSRAKHGMYIIGNADTASAVPMWSSVIRMLEDGGNIGPKLQLECPRHPESSVYVSTPENFSELAPEGGHFKGKVLSTMPATARLRTHLSEAMLEMFGDLFTQLCSTLPSIDPLLSLRPALRGALLATVFVPRNAATHVLLAPRNADGAAFIGKETLATCHAQFRATYSPVTSVVTKYYAADTAVRVSAARNALDIYRYNRIVKKAILDESTRRFIIMANSAYKALIDAVSKREIELENCRSDFLLRCSMAAEQPGSSNVRESINSFKEKDKLNKRIHKFTEFMAAAEQPYGRLLQLRHTWAILWNYRMIFTDLHVDPNFRSELCDVTAKRLQSLIDISLSIQKCSRKAKLLAQEVEAMIYYALFSLLSLSTAEAKGQQLSIEATNELHEQASATIRKCEILHSNNPGTLGFLGGDIEKAKGLLSGATFYSFVSTEEKKQVYDAMASQFSGTGHWYYCRNHHPFTVGECGLPMEQARCPQCGEPVEGLEHAPSVGVTRAQDFEKQFGGN
ncbi:uncharacterized protein KD926_000620 [Aspergillus affinis]|uniref:uncharacterized protein n=1 Tax=Aspergillus affinis TaxID=1070780 RepID=UPI0022FDF557|nr:uncharacterized protein KD926_000620 [Aspergillus affinis]KAI9037333.1 hypothetical protein KD926_000620 [Aspergillus affinis]